MLYTRLMGTWVGVRRYRGQRFLSSQPPQYFGEMAACKVKRADAGSRIFWPSAARMNGIADIVIMTEDGATGAMALLTRSLGLRAKVFGTQRSYRTRIRGPW